MEMVEEMDKLQRSLQSAKPGDKYQVKGFDGKQHSLQIPRFDKGTEYLSIIIVDYRLLSQNMDENGNFKERANPHRLVPFFVLVKSIGRHIKENECIPEPGREPWVKWKKDWEAGENWKIYSTQLKYHVTKHWDTLKRVDQIVCIALGSLQAGFQSIDTKNGKPIVKEFPRRFVQHLTAYTIREAMHELASSEQASVSRGEMKQRSQEAKLTILAQDPVYCNNCINVLKNGLDIEATIYQDVLKRITENTFVICIAPSGSLVSIICDIIPRGPLGMLCDTIQIDTKRWDGLESVEPWLKWDGWDGSKFSEADEDGAWDDLPTKSMVEYEKKCYAIEFGDHEDCLGITNKQVCSEYRRKSPLQCRNLSISKRGKNPKVPNFNDETFYVRKD